MKTLTLIALCGSISTVTALGVVAGKSISSRGATSSTLPTQQSIEQAMVQSRQLMAELQANNWNPSLVRHELLLLPDQAIAETEMKRRRETSFSIQPTNHVAYGNDVAFFATTYARANISLDPNGIEGQTSNRTGFFIVGYRNGEVHKVDVADIKLLKAPEVSRGSYWYCFPGMNEYANCTMYYKPR